MKSKITIKYIDCKQENTRASCKYNTRARC